MSSPKMLTDGVLAAFVGVIGSVIFFIAIGYPADRVLVYLTNANVYNVGEEWESYDRVLVLFNILYFALVIPFLSGIATLFLSAVRKEGVDIQAPVQQFDFDQEEL